MANYTTEEKVEAEILTDITATSSPNTTQVATFITEAQELIDAKTGTTFGTAAFTDEILDLTEDNTFANSQISSLGVVGRQDTGFNGVGNRDLFFLPYSPVVSITSLATNSAGPTETDNFVTRTEQTGTGGDFSIKKSEGAVLFMKNYPRFGERSVKVSGVYGHNTLPNVVSELATKLVAQRILGTKSKKSQTTSVDSISLEGISIRKNIGQTTQFLSNLSREIEDLWKAVGDWISEAA